MENRHELRQVVEDVVVRLPLDHAGECDECPAVDEDVDLEVQISLRAHEARDKVDDEDEAQKKSSALIASLPTASTRPMFAISGDQDDVRGRRRADGRSGHCDGTDSSDRSRTTPATDADDERHDRR